MFWNYAVGSAPPACPTPRPAANSYTTPTRACSGSTPISPLKPFLGPGYAALAARLQAAIAARYALPPWTQEDKKSHKRADRIAAASEAIHVVGWTRDEVRKTLRIIDRPVDADPLNSAWEPWPAAQAAETFLRMLRRLTPTTSS